jgi:sec-independent protein translocase protein TatC
MVRMQVSLITGAILALPFVTLELWGFVAPGLTPDEKKGFHVVVPLSLLFFAMGVAAGYLVLPSAFRWFASFLDPKAINEVVNQNPVLYFTFVAKMLLAFGLVFQLPVVLMFLGWIGVVNTTMLKQNWRGAIVATSVLGAIATPSNDAFTMVMMAIPLAILYLASIWLVGMVEKMRARSDALQESESRSESDVLQESAGLGTS